VWVLQSARLLLTKAFFEFLMLLLMIMAYGLVFWETSAWTQFHDLLLCHENYGGGEKMACVAVWDDWSTATSIPAILGQTTRRARPKTFS
jgi:hypothetical protein